jgi:hypothetical protein
VRGTRIFCLYRGLVGVLKPSPPANIENQNGVKSTLRSKVIAEKLLKRISAFQRKAALSCVKVDVVSMQLGVLGNRILLILRGIALLSDDMRKYCAARIGPLLPSALMMQHGEA